MSICEAFAVDMYASRNWREDMSLARGLRTVDKSGWVADLSVVFVKAII